MLLSLIGGQLGSVVFNSAAAQAPLKGPIYSKEFLAVANAPSVSDQVALPEVPSSKSAPKDLILQEPILHEAPGFNQSTSLDSITIGKPALSALISIAHANDPFGLDSQGSRPIGLEEVAKLTVENNLDIGISRMNERSKKVEYMASLGKFLPDLTLAFIDAYIQGQSNIPLGGLGPLVFSNPIIIAPAGFNYHVYNGGATLFGMLQSKNNYSAARHVKHITVNDALLESAKRYYDLMLQEAILAVRISAVRTSEAQLARSTELRGGGFATSLEVYQAQTQLSQDRQNLIDQQITRRDAAIKLAQHLNIDQGQDLTPANPQLQKIRLVAEKLKPTDLLFIAISNRPELKQYQQLALAAKKQIVINSAKLQPTVNFFGAVAGVGETLGSSSTTVTSTTPVILPSTGAVGGLTTSRQVDRRIGAVYAIGYSIVWNLQGFGTVGAANIYDAKILARRAQLEQQKELNQVIADVRQSYLNTLSSENKIEETIAQVHSATEELRLAQLRYQHGLSKNIDVLRAQQDYTIALIEKAQALTNFNVSEAQLLRDIGVLSMAALAHNVPFNG